MRALAFVIAILALADGVLHLSLDFVLFHGNLFANLLSVLFPLNFLGYVVLAAAIWLGPRWLGHRSWLVDAALLVFAAATFIGWLSLGAPNPLGLGYTSKAIEALLMLAVLLHLKGAGVRSDEAIREEVRAA
jgi:hypothetical protein